MRLPGVLLFSFCTGLFLVAGLAQGGARQAEIQMPHAGGTLLFNEVIAIRLAGLSPEDAQRLVVEVIATTGRDGQETRISMCGKSPLVPVSKPECTGVAWLEGTNLLKVRWNHSPPGLVDGTYLVKVRILVQYTPRLLGIWGETKPVSLKLATGELPSIEILSPQPGSRFELGSRVQIAGRLAGVKFPASVQLQVRERDSAEWRSASEATFTNTGFELTWNTDQPIGGSPLRPAEYTVRVRAADTVGQTCLSNELRIELIRSPRVQIVVDRSDGSGPQPVVAVDARPGELLRFGLVSLPKTEETRFASFQWDFGDGTEKKHDQWPSHSYEKEGVFTVCVTAYSEADFQGTAAMACIEIRVRERPSAVVEREIYGFPVPGSSDMSVMPGFSVRVRLQLGIRDPVIGVSIIEVAPPGWEIYDVTPTGDQEVEIQALRQPDPSRMIWLLTPSLGASLGGKAISILYSLRAPLAAKQTRAVLSGSAHIRVGSERSLGTAIRGQEGLLVLQALPPCVAIAYLEHDSAGGLRLRTPDVSDTYLLAQEQIAIAADLLRAPDKTIPFTGGAVMTPELYLSLRAFFVEDRPVTRCVR